MRLRLVLMAVALAVLAAGCGPRDPGPIYEKPSAYKAAEALYLRGKYAEAKRRFLDLYASDKPHDRRFRQEALYRAARCDQNMGNWSEAVRIYGDILRVPTYRRLEIRALAARADLSREVGDHHAAAHDYKKARRLWEKSPGLVKESGVDRQKLLFGEGAALRSLGRYKEANEVFDVYLDAFPNGRFVKEARASHTGISGPPTTTPFYVLVGGHFSVRGQAEIRARKLRAKGFADVRIKKYPLGQGAVYVVQVGAFDTRREAAAQQQELEGAGFRPTEIRP